MRSLRELQEGFARALISGVSERSVPGIRADGLSPLQRLGFHRTNMMGNYLEALRATYQCIENLVGPGCFAHYAEQFIRETPSRSGDLNRYGRELADFLAGTPIAAQLPYLADVARLEWLLDEVFYEADHPALDLQRLAHVSPERYPDLRFKLNPACRLLSSAYPIQRIWQVSRSDYSGEQSVTLETGGDRVLVRRAGFGPVVESVSAAEFVWLRALRDGDTLGAACIAAQSAYSGLDVSACLQCRVADGTLCDFAVGVDSRRSWAGEESLSRA
jgi:hypothetical protein